MARDIIDEILDDHQKVRALLGEMNDTPPEQREDLFRHIVSELARHEASEESIVHPTMRDEVPQGQSVAEAVLHEESEAEKLLSQLEGMDATSPEFMASFEKLRASVLQHAEHEERDEHPQLRQHLDEQRLREMGTNFEKLKETAPTHPHPKTPQTPEVRAAVGPVAGMFDKARDAVRDAMSR